MRLLINADDLGICRSANEAILACHDCGPLNGASLLVNGDDVEFAAAECVRRPDLDVALHLNYCEGYPVASPESVSLLIGEDGRFNRGFGRLLADNLLLTGTKRRIFQQQLAFEAEAQVEKFRDLLSVSSPIRIDSHVHTTAIPAVARVLLGLAERGVMERVRIPIERMLGWRSLTVNNVKQGILWLLCRNMPPRFASRNVRVTDSIAGVVYSGRMHLMDPVALSRVLGGANGVLEVVVHPGGMTETEAAASSFRYLDFYLSPNRREERDYLIAARDKLLGLGQ